ncbi:MAG: ammonium transporter [Alphaproteobacteria bacterium]|nr:ammonium transporter [Alphaproteobacteria bacterium]
MAQDAAPVIDSGNTAWLLVSTALVMLMTPGLAFFYAGMVKRKNVVATLFQNYAALAVAGIVWAICGYSLVFSGDGPFIGGLDNLFLKGIGQEPFGETGVPTIAFVAFQMMFAIITPALMSGAMAERLNFSAWLLILVLWSLAVYVPVAHWVWGPGGWIAGDGGLDFAGGLVVHATSGCSALMAAILLGKRTDAQEKLKPNDVSLIMLGAALLWFGWFGFNAGSAITSGGLAAHAFMTTFLAAAAAFASWVAVDWIRGGKPSAVGGAIGIIVGLVVITPAAGFVTTNSALIMGLIGGAFCNIVACIIKKMSHMMDDTLDVFACHGVGGILGAIMTGMFADSSVNDAVSVQGLLVSGETGLFYANVKGAVAVIIYSFVITAIIIKVVSVFTKLRVSSEVEQYGLDSAQHGETARHREGK